MQTANWDVLLLTEEKYLYFWISCSVWTNQNVFFSENFPIVPPYLGHDMEKTVQKASSSDKCCPTVCKYAQWCE